MTRDLDRPGDGRQGHRRGRRRSRKRSSRAPGPNLITSVIGLNTFGVDQPIGPDPGLWGDQCFGDQCFEDGGTFDDRNDDEGSFTETRDDTAASCWGAAGCSSDSLTSR